MAINSLRSSKRGKARGNITAYFTRMVLSRQEEAATHRGGRIVSGKS